MNFLNLQYFAVVAEKLNITHAAQKLYISQQSLSNHISNLEKHFGVKLFERSPSLSLTYAGTRLYSYSVKMLDIKKQLENEMNDIKGCRLGHLRIGISYTRGRVFLPYVLPKFKKNNPLIEISLVEGNSSTLEDELLHGHIDLMIGIITENNNVIVTEDIQKERLFLVVPKVFMKELYGENYEIYREKYIKSVNINVFKNYPFLMMTKANSVRKIVDDYQLKTGLKLNIVLETENIETLLSLAYEGMGITVYPEMFINHLSPLVNKDDLTVDFYPLNNSFAANSLIIGYNKHKYLSDAAKEFIEIAKNIK